MLTSLSILISIIIRMINKVLSQIALFLIRLYQIILSPDKGLPRFWLKGKVCRHEPHCSQYALEHIKRFGFFKSILPIMDRVSNCTPGRGIIDDPVPQIPSNSKPLRVVFFSSAPIGIAFLESLWNNDDFQIVGVVTQPDQPSGRGLEMKHSIIKKVALNIAQSKGIQTEGLIQTPQTLKLNSIKYPGEGEKIQSWLQNLQADYFVVTAYGKVLPEHILSIPSVAPVNIHRSLLPKYRGATPVQTSLLNGDKITGITLITMSPGLDEGDIIATKEIHLDPSIHATKLYDIFSEVGPKFVEQKLKQFAAGKLTKVSQDHGKASFTSKIEKEQGLVDIFAMTLEQLLRIYNAYHGRPKIYFVYKDKRVIVENIEIDLEKYEETKHNLAIDEKYNANPGIRAFSLKPEGKKAMNWNERKRGYLKSSQ
ncbi:MAG: membrane protein insertion efficiency factor YidD [Candidatus Absconditabacterales bacterium]